MKKILSVKNMQMCDRLTIEKGKSSIELMFNAAKAVSKYMDGNKILIVVGSGNNGGDGLALATILLKEKKNIEVFLASDIKSEAAKFYYDSLLKVGFDNFADEINDDYDTVVDSIFGIGLDRDLSEKYVDIINKLNKLKGKKVSIDISSGINANTGLLMGVAFRADMTVALAAYKYGHFLQDGKDYAGKVVLEDIGIETNITDARLVERADVKVVFPKRKENSHKYSFGKVTIIGGSEKYQGAPVLAYLAASALRVGAGLVNLAYPRSIENMVCHHLLDAIQYPLSTEDGHIKFNSSELDKIILRSDVIVFGPGIGRSIEVEKSLKYILENFDKRVLVDADGIFAFSRIYKDMSIKSKILLTPHLQEASILLGKSREDISKNIVELIVDFAKENNIYIFMKGASSFVTNGEKIYVINNGSVAQAKAGNGDVLSGVIAGIEAYNNDFLSSGYAGSFLVSEAASLLKAELGQYGVLASDLPVKIKEIQESF